MICCYLCLLEFVLELLELGALLGQLLLQLKQKNGVDENEKKEEIDIDI